MLDISKDYVDPFDSDSIVAKFRDFRDRSRRKFADNYEKMRTDRDFLNGETQWTKAAPVSESYKLKSVSWMRQTTS